MSVTTQEQQLNEDHRRLEENLVAHFKNVLNSCFKNIVSPGFAPENIAIFGSYLTITLIFLLDVTTDPAITFHLLYIFPITFIALHSSRTGMVAGAVALSISLQYVNPFYFQNHALEFPICPFFLIVFSNIICTLAARNLRAHILEMKRLSIIDPLTQLRNRRGLDQAMETEVVRQRRDKNRLSVAVIDLDGFKGLNDTMGHKAGDKALTLFADISRNLLRQTDTICRLGGDEFVIVMPNTHATDCETLCNVLCQTVRTSLSTALSYPMSASIGFTTIENAIENSNKATDDILSIADKALYQAKALGKGCVVRGYAEEHSSLI